MCLPEQKEKAATGELHLPADLDERVEDAEQVSDVAERQHQQRLLQLTAHALKIKTGQ